MIPLAHIPTPHVDFAGLSPLIAFLGGAVLVLMVGLLSPRKIREHGVPALTLVVLGVATGLVINQWHADKSLVDGAIRLDSLSLVLNLVLIAAGVATVLLAWRSRASHEAARDARG